MSEADRAAFEREALDSPALSEALYSELALDSARIPGVQRGQGSRGPQPFAAAAPGHPRWVFTVLPAAAVLALVAATGIWLSRPHETPGPADVLRGAPSEPRLLSPAGGIAHPPTEFRWNLVPGADRYRVELFDAAGHTLGAAVTAETSLAVGLLARRAPEAGEWRVFPIDASGREGSPLPRTAFRVTAPEP
jgi:hypothetical protein